MSWTAAPIMLLPVVVLCLVRAASAAVENCTEGSGVCQAFAAKRGNKGVHLMQLKPKLSRSLLSKRMHEDPSGDGDGGLAPSPPAPALPACCGSCRTDQWCSPKSNSCYDLQAKHYYQPCGEDPRDKVVVGDVPTWADEFDDLDGSGRVNASNWVYENGDNYANNQELQFYTDRSDNSYVQDGVLKIVAKCEDYSSWGYTSARLTTQNLIDWGPGHRIEVKARVPTGRGTWPAIWMLPKDNAYGGWPHSGEIDIMESVGCTSGKVYGTVHTGAFNHMKNTQQGSDYYTDNSDWHTYTIDWLNHKMKWYVDGELYHSFSPDISDSQQWPFNQKFYMILNVAVAGSWGGFCLDGSPSCDSHEEFGREQVMEVDYARVYKIHAQEQAVQE